MDYLDYFSKRLEEVNGFYHDTIAGFDVFGKTIRDGQEKASRISGMTISQLDAKMFSYTPEGKAPWESFYHQTTQGQFKDRIKKEGTNYLYTASICLVLIYEYWTYSREKLKEKDGKFLQSDIMGDIRHYRNAIIHNNGKATERIIECKVLRKIKEGEIIAIGKDEFISIIELIKKELKFLIERTAVGSK